MKFPFSLNQLRRVASNPCFSEASGVPGEHRDLGLREAFQIGLDGRSKGAIADLHLALGAVDGEPEWLGPDTPTL